MVNMIVYFEALVTETKTVLKNLYLYPDQSTPYAIPIDKKCGRDVVYSTSLDEYLNVDDYNIMRDSTTTLGVFKLASDMYTMINCHNIGLEQFDNAYLLVELFTAEIN